MILVIDYVNNKNDLLIVNQNDIHRFSSDKKGSLSSLAEIINQFDIDKPSGIAVRLIDQVQTENNSSKMTWSAVRSAVSLANSLAFAWGVPAVGFFIDIESDEELVAKAQMALVGAEKTDRVKAVYDGKPNITKPKK